MAMKPGGTAGSTSNGGEHYRFGHIAVDVSAHTLSRDGQPQALEPKAFAVLLALLRRPGELLGRDELLDEVWGHRHVTPGVLTRAIAQLRSALEDDVQQPRYIQTQHALGYRFIGELESQAELDPEPQIAAPIPMPTPTPADSGIAVAVAAAVVVPPVVARETEIAPDVLPYAGDERRDPHRALHVHWQWPAIGVVLAVVMVAMAWGVYQRYFAVPARPAEPSIAVLPFTTLSDDRSDRYFAEGLSTEMLNALAGVQGLKVAAWRPAEAIDRKLDMQQLGRMLGVATVLDATVRREGSRLRIDARLSDTTSGYTLWSRSYDRDATAVFDTQSEIASEVARSLVGVLPDAGEGLRKRLTPTRNVAAFDAYLMGLQQLLQPQGADASKKAEGFFRKALAQDSGFARAQAELCRLELWSFESNRNPDAFDNARLACLKAANMDRSLGEVGLALGDLYRVKGDSMKAMRYYDDLLDDPAMRASALVGRAQVYVDQEQPGLAMEQFQQALEASPGDAQVYAEMGYQQFRIGKTRDALASYRKVVALRPDKSAYWSTYGGLLVAAGDNAAAMEALKRSLAIEPNESSLSNLGTLKYQSGDYAGAAEMYRQATDLNPSDFFYWGWLGDALWADPSTRAQSRKAFEQATSLAQRFVAIKSDDAKALASLGWYRAALDEREPALEMVERSEKLSQEPGEVAMINAQTFSLLGDLDQARLRIKAAHAAGIPEIRISTNAVFRHAQLIPATE
jgi:TolB-like protein/DNA-binding winged helix-turn-helix (wHTH) protein/tetratricopeptide (TPR) repeat protein